MELTFYLGKQKEILKIKTIGLVDRLDMSSEKQELKKKYSRKFGVSNWKYKLPSNVMGESMEEQVLVGRSKLMLGFKVEMLVTHSKEVSGRQVDI